MPKSKTQKVKFKQRPILDLKEKISLVNPEKRGSRSDDWYHAVVETMENGVWVADKKVNVVYANNKLCELLGYSYNEIVGKSEYDFWTKKSTEKVKKIIKKDRQKGVSSSYEAEIITKRGDAIPVLVLIFLFYY